MISPRRVTQGEARIIHYQMKCEVSGAKDEQPHARQLDIEPPASSIQHQESCPLLQQVRVVSVTNSTSMLERGLNLNPVRRRTPRETRDPRFGPASSQSCNGCLCSGGFSPDRRISETARVVRQ